MKGDFSFSVDTNLRINSWGKKITEFSGKTSSSVLGKKYYEVLPRIFVENRDAISTTIKNNKVLNLRGYTIKCFYGNICSDIRINPLKTSFGRIKEVKVTISPNSLCAASERLKNSQRLIDIGKIASSLAHGVRNPLNAIKGSVVYLTEKYANEPELIEFTKIMENEITRLDYFISRFLSASFSDLELSMTDVNSLLRKIEIFTSLQIHIHNLKSIYEYGNIPSLKLNSFLIEQAILNVINNAIEVMHSGGILTIKTEAVDVNDEEYVIISITDTGPGINKYKINNISHFIEDNGKGFGLFITREILQYCGGYIEIKSREGKGTTVKLYIPVNRTRGSK